MRRRLLWVLAGLALSAGAAFSFAAPSARAGVYGVHACLSAFDPRNASWRGVGYSAHTTSYAACPGDDRRSYDTGLGSRTTDGSSSYAPANGGSWMEFDAPPGTSLYGIAFDIGLGDGAGSSAGCWESGVWAWNGNDFYSPARIYGLGPCTATQQTGWIGVQNGVSLNGYTKVRVGIHCAASKPCWADWVGGHGTWANLRNVWVSLQDYSAPAAGANAGALWSDGWHRGYQEAWGWAADNAGVRYLRAKVDGAVVGATQDFIEAGWAQWGVRCDFAYAIPCHNLQNGGLALDTTQLSDGPHSFQFSAVDPAGNDGGPTRTIYVDNHAPAAPREIAVSGGDGWRRSNGFDVAWKNPEQGEGSPIASASYRLCRADRPQECISGSQAGAQIDRLSGLSVPDQGEWTLRVWLTDAAGNVDSRNVSDELRLRFDPQVDGVAFLPLDPHDPRRLVAAVSDAVSGIAGGEIALRRQGTETWRPLPTALGGGQLSARVPDTELEDGSYELRAEAWDAAGNHRVADRYMDGSRAAVTLPLRTATKLVGRGMAAMLRVAFGVRATIVGAVRTYDGRPVSRVPVLVSERLLTGGPARTLGTLRADGDGRFSYSAPAGPWRTLRFSYLGNETLKPAAATATLVVPAATSMRVDRRAVRNGRSVVFSGRLLGRPLPPAGKLVVMQAYYRGAWRTFAVTHADRRGEWRQRYRFLATRGRVVYRFRARIEREASYPYALGIGPVVSVAVSGR